MCPECVRERERERERESLCRAKNNIWPRNMFRESERKKIYALDEMELLLKRGHNL